MTTSVRWSVALAALVVARAAVAQPQVRDHRDKDKPPVVVRDNRTGPHEAPPAPKVESYGTKAGFVWITGRWDWKAGKWEWLPGHWERERAGKQWRPGRWDKQGDAYVYVEGTWGDGGGAPVTPPAYDGPREPPPPVKPETYGTKAGFVWVAGRWDWKGGKWEWLAGHWERERAGKKWRAGRWDKDGDHYKYVEGDWIDEGASATPPPTLPPDGGRPHHEWKLDRPVVGSYWPTKGKAGTRVVIRGKNFGPETQVIWAGEALRGARVKADEIAFVIPANAASGAIALRSGDRRRDLPVGMFEVAAAYDPVAEQKKLEDEQRKAAEAAVAARQKAYAADRAAREAEIKKRIDERTANRDQRRADRLADYRKRWDAAFLADAETQGELTLHAQRVADLERMRDVADLSNNSKLSVRIEVAQERETARHDQRMAALQAAFTGGKP